MMQAEHAQTGEPRSRTQPVASVAPRAQGSARLGGARADVGDLLAEPRDEIRASLGPVKADPSDVPHREELRRKLNALSSSARMMKFDAMTRGIADALGVIDRTPIDAPLDALDLELIEQLVEDLPRSRGATARPARRGRRRTRRPSATRCSSSAAPRWPRR